VAGLRKLIFSILGLIIGSMCAIAEIYNPGDTVPIFFYVDPAVSLTGNVTAYVRRDTTDTLSTVTLALDSDSGSLVYYGYYNIPDTLSEGTYNILLKFVYNSQTYYQIKEFSVRTLRVVVSDSLANYGYITHDQIGGRVLLPGGHPAQNADIVVYLAGTTNVVYVKHAAVDAAGEFKIWVPTSQTYDLEVRLPGYYPKKFKNITPQSP
jgi:hypothetical protein